MNTNLNAVTSCEVCGKNELIPVLNLGLHPMCDDLIEVGSEKVCKEYPIEINFCDNCLTAHQKFQVPKHDLFPMTYHYRSRFTSDVLNGMINLVDSCVERFGSIKDKKVLDIGCNDGSLLDFFQAKGANTFGIEPTGAFHDAMEKMHIVYNEYLSVDIANKIVASHGKFDFITFTNVFAHIENLTEVLESLRLLMHEKTVIVIENHYLGAVLAGNQFDTFYHEHPRTYSYKSFVFMAKSLGLEPLLVEFPSRYGGNIRVCLGNSDVHGKADLNSVLNILEKESQFLSQFTYLNSNIEKWKINKKKQLNLLVSKYGKISAKAFPGRAAILVKLLQLDSDIISEVFEKPGSLKIGYYLPGTRVPIKSDDELLLWEDKSKPIINLAWHISTEIHNYLRKNNYTGEIIDILSPDDFV